MSERTLKFKDFLGNEVEAIPKLFLYEVKDFKGDTITIPGIRLYTNEEEGLLPYATLTKSFGEFIAVKNSAYIDTNNCPFAPQLLEVGIAKDTGFTKHSGMCIYPLWVFDEDFLRDIGPGEYERYSHEFDEYF